MFQCSKHSLVACLVGYGGVYAVYDGKGKGMNTHTESCPNLKVQPGGYILVAQLLQHGTTKWFIESLRSTNENHHIICRCWPRELTKTAKISVAVCFCWSLGKLYKKWVTQHEDLGPTPWLVSGKIETETICITSNLAPKLLPPTPPLWWCTTTTTSTLCVRRGP